MISTERRALLFWPIIAATTMLWAVAVSRSDTATDRVWIGPKPFQTGGRELRDDYWPTLTDAGRWPTVLARTDVWKSYIMLLPDVPLPGKQGPELSDDELKALIAFMKEHNLKVAFEVGGLRNSKARGGDQAGEKYAKCELKYLLRWVKLGGRIDYLTTDHAVMMNMRGVGFPGPGLGPDRPWKMTVQELTDELVDYFCAVHEAIPEAKFGVIESLGFFQVTGPDGREYPHTDPLLPVWRFTEYFDYLLEAMARANLVLDHFHIDFGFEGVQFDGRAAGALDFGRVLGVESYVQSKGVKAGVIVNAFHDRSVKEPDPKDANREATERTIRFYREYEAAGGKADHILLQTWQPYPDRTGPEDVPNTVLNIARDILRHAE